MQISDRIRKIYRENCKSIKDFADRIGVSDSSVNKWLSGDVIPKKDKIQRIAEEFNTTAEWIEYGMPSDNSIIIKDEILNSGECATCNEYRDEIIWLRKQLSEKTEYIDLLKEKIKSLES